MKAYTDLKQSKILAGILPHDTADQTYERWAIAGANFDIPEEMLYKHNGDIPFQFYSGVGVPCWSLSALMNLLPSEFTEVGKYSTTKYEIDIRKYKFTDDSDLHQIAYGNYKVYEDGSSSWKDMINTGEKEDLLDAAFEMVVWLKTEKHI